MADPFTIPAGWEEVAAPAPFKAPDGWEEFTPSDASDRAKLDALVARANVLQAPEWWEARRTEAVLADADPIARAPALISEPYRAVASAGASIGSTVARPFSKGAADYLAQTKQDIGRVGEAARKDDWSPWLSRIYGGAVESLTQAGIAAPLGPAGIIGSFAATEANQALYDAEQAGLKGNDRLKYAAVQGAIEGTIAGVFQKFAPGLEKFIPQIAGGAMKLSGKQFLTMTAQELPEELLTELGHAVAEAASGVDPRATNADQLVPRMVDTVAQTLATLGLAQTTAKLAQMQAIRAKGFVSEQEAQDLGLTPEESKNRASRKAAVDKRIQDTRQEIERASTVPRPKTEVRPEPGGEDVRGEGEDQVRAEPAGEGAPAPEVPVAAEPTAEEAAPAPEVPIDEDRVSELLKKRGGKTGNKGLDARREETVRRQVAEEAEALRQYPPGTTLEIEGYHAPFEVKPDGTLVEIATGRQMGDNAGAILRQYTPEQIHVISRPETEPAKTGGDFGTDFGTAEATTLPAPQAPTQPQTPSEAQPAPEAVPQPETLPAAAQEPEQPQKRTGRKEPQTLTETGEGDIIVADMAEPKRGKKARLKTAPAGDSVRITSLPKGSVDSIKQALADLVAEADSKNQSVEASRYLPLELQAPADQEALSAFLKEQGFQRSGESLRRDAKQSTKTHEDAILAEMRKEPESLHVFSVLRERTGIPKAEFDAAVLKMAREEKISLHQHDFPHSPAETDESRSQYVQGVPTSRHLGDPARVPHYIGAAIRKKKSDKGVSGEASKPTDRPDIVPQPGSASGAMLQPVQMPELFQIAKELMEGKEPQVKKLGGAAGRFKGLEGVGPLAILIDPKTAESEQALSQTLAHEIGHLIDFLPDNTLRRGNLLGRLQSLRSFIKHNLPPLEKNAVYRQELIDLTKWWSGDYTGGKKSYVKYRESSRELYAEALSVFLNSPGDLESRAPQFYKALLENLDSKPDVLAAYSTLQQMLNGTGQELAESRTQTLREMFGRAEEHINSLRLAQEQQKKSAWAGITDFLGQYFLTSAQPVFTRLGRKPIKRSESPDAQAARFALDELFTIDSPNHTLLRNLDEQVQQPLIAIMQERGLDRKAAEAEAEFTLGEYLYHWRVANERDAVANPAGFSATPSKAQLDAIKTRIGDDAYARLQEHAQTFHDLAYSIAQEAAKEGVYNRKTFDEIITPNKDNYAAFRVTHYIDSPDMIATGVIQQVGTFSDIQNPYYATVLKLVRLNRLIELNRAKNRTRVFLEKNFPGDIKPVETVFTGEGRARIPKRRPGHKQEHLVELVDGHPTYFEVPTEIAKAFSTHDIGGLGRIAALINSAAYKVFHPFFVTYNPGFVLANPFRDLRRTWVNLGSTDGITLGKLLSEWVKALPVAHRRAKGIEDAVIREMIDSHALDVPYTDIAAEGVESQIDALFKRHGLRGGEQKPALQRIPVIGKVLELIEHAGAVTETASKVAGWRVLEEKGVPVQERSYRVRKYVGTPDFKQRGLATGLTNAMLMYSRVRWNGLQADIGLATNPDTAAGWWWRQLVNVVLPTSMAKAAAYGGLGWALRAMFSVDDDDEESPAGKAATWTDETAKRIAKYFLTDYDVLPLGVNAEGKAVFITIPRDDIGKFIARTWWHLTDLTQLAAGHELREGEGARDVLGNMFTDLQEQLIPSASPPIEITNKWLQYARGINPIDSFYNQQIVPRKEWDAGGWQADSKMIAWTLDKFGAPGAIIHYPLSPLLGESFEAGTSGGTEAVMKTAGSMTGLNRFLRISDSGLTSDQWARLEKADQEEAAFHASLPKSAKDASSRRYFLMRRESLGDALSEKEQKELHDLNLFYNAAYLPLRKMLKEGDDAAVRKDMQAAANNPSKLWSDPPASIAEEVESYQQRVVMAAVANPPKDRERLEEYNKELAASHLRLKHFASYAEAAQLLRDYYFQPDESGRRRMTDAEKKSYNAKLAALRKVYGD